jgi:hypothetical protein
MGTMLLALHSWTILIGYLILFGLGGLALNSGLYQSELVPRWLSVWGLIGAALAVAYGLLGILGTGFGYSFGDDILLMKASPFAVLGVPIHVQEMVFAVYLIAKGFRLPAPPSDSGATTMPGHETPS